MDNKDKEKSRILIAKINKNIEILLLKMLYGGVNR